MDSYKDCYRQISSFFYIICMPEYERSPVFGRPFSFVKDIHGLLSVYRTIPVAEKSRSISCYPMI